MDTPFFLPATEVADRTYRLGAWVPLPTLGWLPVNSYLIRGEAPLLVDTHMRPFGEPLVEELRSLVDLPALRWIWITHMDADHIGNLARLLELCPQAQVVTNFLGQAKMGLLGLPAERAVLVAPGEALDIGDRELRAFTPPVFDAPETMGFLDSRTRALFSSDCFGALQPRHAPSLDDVEPADLARGMVTWAHIDSPWLPVVDPLRWGAKLDALAALEPSVTLGSHLQAAPGMVDELLGYLRAAAPAQPLEPRRIEAVVA